MSAIVRVLRWQHRRLWDALATVTDIHGFDFLRSTHLTPEPFRAKRICMVTHSFYESDNRIIRYAETLAARGDLVEVVALRRSPQLQRHEEVNGVMVHRIQDRFGKHESSSWSYLWPLLRFALASWWWLAANSRRRPFDVIHVHNIPDFLVFATWYAKLRGTRIILDIHDIVPEFFSSKFAASQESVLVRSLLLIERLSAKMADHVILANHLWLEKYAARSAPRAKCSVFINYVDEQIFRPQSRAIRPSGQLILFPGGLQWHQGLDIAIRAFAILKLRLPDVRFHICGDGNAKSDLISLVEQLDLDDSVKFFDPLPLRDIAKVMAEADLGVVPKRADSFGNEAYSTKIMEFMSLGVPVVVSSTKVDRYYFDESVVCYFESGNEKDLAKAMHEVLSDSEARDSLVRNASEYVARNSWARHKSGYLDLIDRLIERR